MLPDKTKIDGKLNATFRVIFKHCAILQIFQNSDRLFKAVKLWNVQVKVLFFSNFKSSTSTGRLTNKNVKAIKSDRACESIKESFAAALGASESNEWRKKQQNSR